MCHIPPGNPDNAHNICVGDPAVPAHLRHGDFTGPCECIVRDGACEEGDRCCEEGDSCNEGFCTPPPDTGDTGDTGDTAEPPARAAALLNHSGPAPSGKGDWPGLFPP